MFILTRKYLRLSNPRDLANIRYMAVSTVLKYIFIKFLPEPIPVTIP